MDPGDNEEPPPRPEKNCIVFFKEDEELAFPTKVFDGQFGKLPLFISIYTGHMAGFDPFMDVYETDENFFAYKEDRQRRVLLRDRYNRTLSLPVHSDIAFRLVTGGTPGPEVTMSEILKDPSRPLPVSVQFARVQEMEFWVGEEEMSREPFRNLSVTRVYEEPFYWCLAIRGNGMVKDVSPVVLPRNLLGVCFTPMSGVVGVSDPIGKLQEFKDKYLRHAQQLCFHGDPFFQELAFVSREDKPLTTVEPYIDANTFITIRYTSSSSQLPGAPPPPPPASRKPKSAVKDTQLGEKSASAACYSALDSVQEQDHVYSQVAEPSTSHTRLHSKGKRSDQPKDTACLSKSSNRPAVSPMMSPPLPPRTLPEVKARLDGLSVEDVVNTLKELGLSRHAKKFRKNRIDGVLLQKLEEGTLKWEFKMTHLEYLLLSTFVKEGHVPLQKNS